MTWIFRMTSPMDEPVSHEMSAPFQTWKLSEVGHTRLFYTVHIKVPHAQGKPRL